MVWLNVVDIVRAQLLIFCICNTMNWDGLVASNCENVYIADVLTYLIY